MGVLLLFDWNSVETMTAPQQASFLLDVAEAAWGMVIEQDTIMPQVLDYLALARAVLAEEAARLPELMRFLHDADGTADVAGFADWVKDDETAEGALSLAAFACAFTARVVAKRAGVTHLPDQVRDALPRQFDDHRFTASCLGLA